MKYARAVPVTHTVVIHKLAIVEIVPKRFEDRFGRSVVVTPEEFSKMHGGFLTVVCGEREHRVSNLECVLHSHHGIFGKKW